MSNTRWPVSHDSTNIAENIAKVRAWSQHKSLQALWQELHRRMGASQRPVSSVQVPLDPATNRDLSSLLGRNSRYDAPKARVTVSILLRKLGLDYEELRILVESLQGPIEDRAAQRIRDVEQKEQLWEHLSQQLGDVAPLSAQRIRAGGVPGNDLKTHQAQILSFLSMVKALPLREPMPVPMFSWHHTQDPHALDSGTSLYKWLGWVLAEISGHDLEDLTGTQIRAAGTAQGLLFDRLSTPTLTCSLRATPQTSAGQLLQLAWTQRVPMHLSSSVLDHADPSFLHAQVLCVENPSVVEWLHIHQHAVPVVCSSGWPSTDCQRLLGIMVEQGITLHYAGDFDPSGLKIAHFMHQRFNAQVHMSAQDYQTGTLAQSHPWPGEVPPTPWCPKLQLAIQQTGQVRYQEDPALLEGLLLACKSFS